MGDAQASMCTILKPFAGFEEIYQGVSVETPIPLTPVENDQVILTDLPNPPPTYDPLMVKYMPVPRGSTVLIWFPRTVIEETPDLLEKDYRYHIRWRLRSVQDRLQSGESPIGATKTFSTVATTGAITSPGATKPQLVVPACMSAVISPSMDPNWNPRLGLNIKGETIADSQGLLGTNLVPDYEYLSRGPLFFPPVMLPAVGDEMAIYADRTFTAELDDTWDFSGGTPFGTDAPFSAFYGVGAGTFRHAWYPSHGIYVATLARNTYP